jgi:hypothetical protein
MKEYLIWISAGIVAIFVLVLGLNVALRGPRSRFLIALSACLFWLSGLTGLGTNVSLAQEKPRAQAKDKGQEEIQKRIKEIKRTAEWKKLRRIYKELLKLDKEKRPLTRKLEMWLRNLRVHQGPSDDTFPLTTDEAIRQITLIISELATRIDMRHSMIECYDRKAPPRKPGLENQMELLEKAYEEGRISKKVYEKARKAMRIFKASYAGRGLSERNIGFLCKLLVELCKPHEVDITKLTPEIAKRIDELIEKLGDDKWDVREDAHKKLLEIGGVAIPAIKKALKHKDPEVRWRAKAILEELEW